MVEQVDMIALAVIAVYTLALSEDLTPSIAFSMWVVLSVLHGKIFRFPGSVSAVEPTHPV